MAKKLNPAQKEAVEYLNGPLLVLAGPGTGKTQLLSAKVEYILKNTDTDPENILCLTFTDAGARNMRDRLRSMIGKGANGVNIHTYHAFGSDLLAQYKNYATEFSRNLDQPIDTVTQYKIIKNIQANLPALDILKTANISDILSTISSAKSARLSASDLSTIAEYNIEKTKELNQAVSPILKNATHRMKFDVAVEQIYLPLLEIFATFYTGPILKNIEPEAKFLALELKHLIENEQKKERPSVSPLTKWKNANFEFDSDENYRLKNVVSNKKLISLANIMAEYDDYLRSEGLFDFADMIEEAIHILKEDNGFRLTLSERYQYVLLDEFQDTNPSQFELIHLLTDYESPCIMAVGDDDQAIFAFQGANASNLLDFKKTYNAKVITLTENYRSTQEILDSSYKIAQQISESFAKHHGIVKRLKSMKDKIRISNISRHEFLSSDSEYYWVAQKIHDLIKAGEKQSDIAIITPKHKYITPLLPYLKAYDDINISYEKRENVLEEPAIHELATLARFIYDSSKLEPATYRLLEIFSFPRWGINPATAISALQSHPTLKDLEDSDDENLSSAAKTLSNLIALSFATPLDQLLPKMLELNTIESKSSSSGDMGQSSKPFSVGVCGGYDRAQARETRDDGLERRDPIENGFTTLSRDHSDTDSGSPDSYNEFHLYELLSVLRENLASHIKEPNPKLKDFIEFLDDYEAAGEAILNTSPYQDSENAVQIMTAHKSKGLEFKHVFLVATDNISWGKAKGNNNQLTLPKNLIQIRHTGITDDERLRLFFVAITRAEQTLTMTNSIKDFSGKSPARLDYLEEYESEDSLISPFLPDPVIHTHYDDLSDDQKAKALSYQWLSAYQNLTPDLKPLLEKRIETLHFSASHLTTFVDLRYAGPMEFYKRYLLRAPAEPASTQIIFGNLIHNTFEAITNNSLDFEQALEFYKLKLDESPVTPDQAKDLLEKGTATLTASFKKFLSILQHPGAHAEVNLSSEHLMLDEIPLTGKIDHLNIDEDNKTIEVYDFKTGPFHAEGWNSYPTLFLYKLQLEFYKLLLNLSPTYRKYTVTTGHILFVTPGPTDGQVHDKSYEFTKESSEELKSLLRAVYSHIKSLDFLGKASPLCIYPDSSRSLKNIKDFITTLETS